MENSIEKSSLKEQIYYIGMDVHVKNWSITILSKNLFIKRFTQEPKAEILIKHLQKHYPGASYKCVYEAGYSGFCIADDLNRNGIECIVVNPADIPVTNKQKEQKTDRSDSKKLAEMLRAGLLHGIYIPDTENLEDRLLLRMRSQLVRQQSAVKNRIKACLSFYGIRISEEQSQRYWSKNYLNYLHSVKFTRSSGQYSFEVLLQELEYFRKELLAITRKIRELACTDKYAVEVKRLRTIPGIGILNAMTILTEISDIRRFSSANKFRGYIGLIPREHSSGGSINKSEMSRRGNNQLKNMLIESAWVAEELILQ